MSLSLKRRCLVALVVFGALWPLAHHAIVRALDLNPWNWAGWAMYTTPPRLIRHAVTTGSGVPIPPSQIAPQFVPAARDAYARYEAMRVEFGSRVEPDDYAAVLLAAFPQVDEIQILVEERRIDRKTASLRRYELSGPYIYRR